jgi:hypothetical protein
MEAHLALCDLKKFHSQVFIIQDNFIHDNPLIIKLVLDKEGLNLIFKQMLG